MTLSNRFVRRLAAWLCSPATLERLIDPVLADIELERRQALASGRAWRARWVVVSGYVGLIWAVVLHGVHRGAALGISPVAARTAVFSACAFLVLTYALIARPWMRAPRVRSYADWVAFGVDLIPQSIPVSVPIALAFGIVCGWSPHMSVRAAIRRAMLLGVVGVIVALSAMQWMIPAANQAYRAQVVKLLAETGRYPRVAPLRGLSERSLTELAALRRRGEVGLTTGTVYYAPDRYLVRRLDEFFHRRVALAFAAGPFCLAAAAIALVFRRRAVAILAFCAVLPLYIAAIAIIEFAQPAMFGVQGVRASILPIVLGWLPNTALVMLAVVLLLLRVRAPRPAGARS